jgi:putative addiction module component (TIGR02574 family)
MTRFQAMSNYDLVLEQVRGLSSPDQARLIQFLLEAVPYDEKQELHPSWEAVVHERVRELEAGQWSTTSWDQIQVDALARVDGRAID